MKLSELSVSLFPVCSYIGVAHCPIDGNITVYQEKVNRCAENIHWASDALVEAYLDTSWCFHRDTMIEIMVVVEQHEGCSRTITSTFPIV